MSEYYLVSLNNNDNIDKFKLKNIIYKGIYYDIPFAFEGSRAYELYEDIEIMVYKSIYGYKDILTGEILIESKDGNTCNLSFNSIKKASSIDIIRMCDKYKSMSEEDKLRYKNELLNIKNKTISIFNKNEEIKKYLIMKQRNSLEYLHSLQDNILKEN